MIVVSDTSPVNYLVLTGYIDLLRALFGQVVIPEAVVRELQHGGTPDAVRQWISEPPTWVLIRAPVRVIPRIQLGRGEAEAISLALEMRAALVLVDDHRARQEAKAQGLSVAGTLNVLEAAANRGLLDLPAAVAKLRQTNFHISERIVQQALKADAERRQKDRT